MGISRVDVLLAGRDVVYAVVGHGRREPRCHLVDAERAATHPAELAAEALDERLRPLLRVLGRRLERVDLRLDELGRDPLGGLRGDVDPLLDQIADAGRDVLDGVELARLDVQALRHLVGRAGAVVRQLPDQYLGRHHRRLDRRCRYPGVHEKRPNGREVTVELARRTGRRRRVDCHGDGPLDKVGADRLTRRARHRDGVARVACVVNRPGDGVRRQHRGDREREQTEEELGDGDGRQAALHRRDDAKRGYAGGSAAVYPRGHAVGQSANRDDPAGRTGCWRAPARSRRSARRRSETAAACRMGARRERARIPAASSS